MSNIDETELARLEALAAHYANVVTLDNVSIPHQIIKAVPALVAEVRRLRAEAKQGGVDYCSLMDRHDAQFVRAEKLREKIEAWEWLDEVDCLYDNVAWLFDLRQCAIDELYATLTAAREAAHAYRE